MLFQRKSWSVGYARALRDDPYFKVVVPNGFHRKLHERLHGVQPPSGGDCRKAYQELVACFNDGLLTLQDPPEARLQFLIDEWAGLCPATVDELRKQQAIFSELAWGERRDRQEGRLR